MNISTLKRFLLGNPIASQRSQHERLNIPLALAVFAADALSSTAYATDEILIALTMALGPGSLGFSNLFSLPVMIAILLLMALVVISYRQVITAYPGGGGSYEVAKQQLGPTAAQIAGAALLIDYILTVAVSVSAGVAALTSTALVPHEWAVTIALGFIGFMTYINLRGVRESGKVLATPAYLFIFIMLLLLGMGFYKLIATGFDWSQLTAHPATAPMDTEGNTLVGMALLLLLVKAFSHGCAALTGIEAISNGVTAFKPPVAINANRTMVLMALILSTLFAGMTLLASGFHVLPAEGETIVSQIGRAVFGTGSWLYYGLQALTMIILVLAANTSFAGFPRLANILADDGLLPRQLMSLGDRLVFSNGILFLGVLSGLLVWGYHADTHALIPLYAVGVFLSFTLAQVGMCRYHLNNPHPGWKSGLIINALGALVTAIVTLILTVEKFTEGAWIVVVAIPLLIWHFRSIKSHYECVGRQLALPTDGYCPLPIEHTVLVLVSSLNRGTIPALEYAKTISDKNVEAVHVELNPAATQRLVKAWDEWGCGVPLTILKSPYRSIVQPLLDYIDEVEARHEHDLVTIIVPEFVTKKFWHNFLHNQTSLLIKTILRFRKGKVVTSVRYYLDA